MIKVTFSKNGFSVSGHSGYEDAGKDIVCAAVSSCANMVLAGLEDVLDIRCIIKTDASIPFLSVELPAELDGKKADGARLMLDAFRLQIQSVEEQYGDYLKLF